jgi:hypothetical protein
MSYQPSAYQPHKSTVALNFASTSNDNIYGTVTYD